MQIFPTLKRRPPIKWLNVVLDINGALCECVHPSFLKDVMLTCPKGEADCLALGTLVGPTMVFTCPRLHDFLVALSNVAAHVMIWSSMKKSSVNQIISYQFDGLPYPDIILSQEDCGMIEISKGRFLMHLENCIKLVFLKMLSQTLFYSGSGLSNFNLDDILLIDNSPDKSVCNYLENAIFLDSWSRHMHSDDVLMGKLYPWLCHLRLLYAPRQLQEFVDSHWFGW